VPDFGKGNEAARAHGSRIELRKLALFAFEKKK
jgi:hypothetical protein